MNLLFFDIDGTLFDDSARLPASVKPALNQAHANGCLLFLNTGRTLCNLDRRLDDLPLDGMVTGCGSRVIFRGKTLKAFEYSPEDTRKIRQVFLQSRIPLVYECDTAMYFDPVWADYPVVQLFRRFSDNAGITRDITDGDLDFRAVKMFCFSDTAEPILRLMDTLTAAGYPYEAIDRGQEGWEIVPSGCTKAGGIDMIREAAGAPLDACYAFGDSTNDLAMLEHVPNSVAMGNAPEEVKSRCAFVADRPENDGIEKALKHLRLI